MRIFLSVLILIFSLQTWTKADDIRDFQIEGMSIGDSATDYYSIKNIKSAKQYNCRNASVTNCEMYWSLMGPKGIYTGNIQLVFKKNDPKFKIYGIVGTVTYIDNIEACYTQQKKISLEFDELFPSAIKKEYEKAHSADKTGKSRNNTIHYLFQSDDAIYISCYDWSKKMGYNDHLRIMIRSKEFREWINNKAYK